MKSMEKKLNIKKDSSANEHVKGNVSFFNDWIRVLSESKVDKKVKIPYNMSFQVAIMVYRQEILNCRKECYVLDLVSKCCVLSRQKEQKLHSFLEVLFLEPISQEVLEGFISVVDRVKGVELKILDIIKDNKNIRVINTLKKIS